MQHRPRNVRMLPLIGAKNARTVLTELRTAGMMIAAFWRDAALPQLPDHKDVKATILVCTHILNRGGKGVKGPLAP